MELAVDMKEVFIPDDAGSAASVGEVRIAVSEEEVLEELFAQYRPCGSPISVNFRKLMGSVKYGERASHMIHLYPAKLLPHIPIFFLKNNILSKPGGIVCDPFCGTGTVLLEAMLAGRHALGADSNPLARLISKVKTTPIANDKLMSSLKRLIFWLSHSNFDGELPNVVNIDYWFSQQVQKQLNRIRHCIANFRDEDLRDFYLVAFSNTVKRVSRADPAISVPVRVNPERYTDRSARKVKAEALVRRSEVVDVSKVFLGVARSNIERMGNLVGMLGADVKRAQFYCDARSFSTADYAQPNDSVDLVITSPPYLGAQKYVRSSSLSLGWLSLCEKKDLASYEKDSIGREHFRKNEITEPEPTGIPEADTEIERIYEINPLRAQIAASYLREMREAVRESARMTKLFGYLVLVIANNEVCGKVFPTQAYVVKMLEEEGYVVKLRLLDSIHSRGLMTKRNKAAGVISSEWVVVLQKTISSQAAVLA